MVDQTFAERVAGLADGGLAPSGLRFLSDLGRAEQAALRDAWPALPVERRRQIVSQLAELAELSVELDFRRVFQVALGDADSQVVASAIDGLWEDESPALLRQLNERLADERSEVVRLALLRALARFAELAVHGKLADGWAERLRNELLAISLERAASREVRRRALEAVAVFANDQAVSTAIEAAYRATDATTRASALYAMGRNLDLNWLPAILVELESDEPMLRFEAARAAGELGSQRAVPKLLDRLSDTDRETQLAAVAALGKLGGRTAGTALGKLLTSEDEGLREAAEEALDELSFGADPLFTP